MALNDETLSTQTRQALATFNFDDNLAVLKDFMSRAQLQGTRSLALGKEGQFYMEKIQILVDTVRSMPQTYDTESARDEAVVELRYFSGESEWLIVEKDCGVAGENSSVQHQAFGSADLGYRPELGYISIKELLEFDVEIDLYFESKTLEACWEARQNKHAHIPT